MIAADCGYDNVPLVGDMFIARTHTPPSSSSSSSSTQPMTVKRHVDFRLTDLESSQPWLRRAKVSHSLRIVICNHFTYLSPIPRLLLSLLLPIKSDNYEAAAAVGRVAMEGGGEVGGRPKGEDVDSGGKSIFCLTRN
jgi:hypothetical protein